MRKLLAVIALGLAGCMSSEVHVRAEPVTNAALSVDGTYYGELPRSVKLDLAHGHVLRATAPGWFPAEVTLSQDTVDHGEVRLVLREDRTWRETTTCDAANAWVRLQIRDPEGAWQRILDAVTEHWPGLEQVDGRAGWVKSVALVRAFAGPRGDVRVRTRFIAAIAQREPLVFKVRIDSERSEREGPWEPFPRVFHSDAKLVEQLGRELSGSESPRVELPQRSEAPVRRVREEPRREETRESADTKTIHCGACGERILAKAKFCSACGKPQPPF